LLTLFATIVETDKNIPFIKTSVAQFLQQHQLSPFSFQTQTWQAITQQQSGLVNAPTGFGKTFSVFLGAVNEFISENPSTYNSKKNNGLQLLWVTPLRALAKDIARAMQEVVTELGLQWQVAIRNGDTSSAERQKQKKNIPEIIIITPESLHLMLALKGNSEIFTSLKILAVDEWHELLGSKRAVMMELAISRLVGINPQLMVWGISATIGNLQEAKDVLLAPLKKEGIIIHATEKKLFEIEAILPDEIEKYPWAGHLGLKLAHTTLPIFEQYKTTLVFINTRGMSESWYQTLLQIEPNLAGLLALHHGSIEKEVRLWVEDALHTATLKAVVCTSSLDLGVDFRPVECVIQVGSPKGVARFVQRAGRSGHQPNAISKIYFLPTHSLELMEAAALKEAIAENIIESRLPLLLCFDVLVQYLCTLAVGEGFYPQDIFNEIKSTYCFADITEDEFNEVLQFITTGGPALQAYDDFKKVEIINGKYCINNRRVAMRHRLHIGAIVSDAMLSVNVIGGKRIGVIEEYFISKLNPGDVFALAGSHLEFVGIKGMTVQVRRSNAKKAIIPSWNGGRLPLSSQLGFMLRKQLNYVAENNVQHSEELQALMPLFNLQQELSHIPKANELLIEHIETKDGFHLFVYPFEGRLVHEAMAALLCRRLSKIIPITFSFAMNDYGFELLSDQPIPLDDSNVYELFSLDNLFEDIQQSVNSTEMAKRKFRDIAVIGGMIFQGMPGEQVKQRHLQNNASLLFNVLQNYEPNNLLLRQAYNEVMQQQMEEVRLRDMLERIAQSNIVITYPKKLTPFCFPLKVDILRESMSSEKLEDRIQKMIKAMN
jgi:ATP-dependent helicase Lhr and Lhr-like helicase